MLFKELAEIYCFKEISFTRVLCQSLSLNLFRVVVYSPGHNRVFAYKMILCKKKTKTAFPSSCLSNSRDSEGKSSFQWEKEFSFLASVYLSFPVYFVSFAKNRILAFGSDEKIDLNIFLNDSILKHQPKQTWPVKHTDYGALTDTSQSNHNFSIRDSVCTSVQKKRVCSYGKPNISCVSTCISNCFLVCRTDDCNRCWFIEIVMKGNKNICVAKVSFPKDHLTEQFLEDELGPSETFGTHTEPYLICISTEGALEFESKEILTKQSFVNFFGPEALAQSNAVILLGVPDGRIMWGSFSSEHVPEFKLLCDIAQPVCGIHTLPHGTETPGDSLVVIGSFGKVLKLSYFPEMRNQSMQQKMSLTALVSYIPSPVFVHTVVNTGIYHVSSDGQLWVSEQNSVMGCQVPEKKFISKLADLKGIVSVCSISHNEGLILCLSANGCLYLGDFKPLDESETILPSTREVPCYLDTCCDQSVHLQSLECVKLKQRTLFSQMAILASALEGKLLESPISVSVSQLNEKHLIQISFDGLQILKLHPFLWCLSATISRGFQQSSLTCKQISPFFSDCHSLNLESKEQFSLFVPDSFLPWFIEGGLVLNIPKDFRRNRHLKFLISKLPCCIQLQGIIVYELYFLHTESLVDPNMLGLKCSGNDGFSAILEVMRCKPSSKHLSFKIHVNEVKFPLEFTFQLFAATAESVANCRGNLLYRSLFKFYPWSNKIHDGHQDVSVVCRGHQVKIEVNKKTSFLYILLSTACFKLLIGMKFAVIHTIMFSSRSEGYSENCVLIMPNLIVKLEIITTLKNSDITFATKKSNSEEMRISRQEFKIILRNLQRQLETSRKIYYSLCGEEIYVSSDMETDIFEIYRLLRCDLSKKLYF